VQFHAVPLQPLHHPIRRLRPRRLHHRCLNRLTDELRQNVNLSSLGTGNLVTTGLEYEDVYTLDLAGNRLTGVVLTTRYTYDAVGNVLCVRMPTGDLETAYSGGAAHGGGFRMPEEGVEPTRP